MSKDDPYYGQPRGGIPPGSNLEPIGSAAEQDWEAAYEAAYATTLDTARSDEFRAGAEAAHHALVNIVRHELLRRALMPYRKPVYRKKGTTIVKVDDELIYDNRLLAWVAERISPDEFNLARRLEVGGRNGQPVRFVFEMSDSDDDEQDATAVEDADYDELPPGPQPD